MRLERGASRDDVLNELAARAEQAWGAERRQELTLALENTATALAALAQEPLDLLELEPDFVDGTAPRSDGASLD